MIMRRRLSLGLALGAILLASGCDETGQGASRSEPDSAQAASSNPPSNTPPATPPATTPGTAGVLERSHHEYRRKPPIRSGVLSSLRRHREHTVSGISLFAGRIAVTQPADQRHLD